MRVIRSLLLFKLGFWAGMMAAAAFVKRAVPSRGDEESDELALVAVMDGIELTNRSKAFTGGSMVAWYGGIAVDLREAELAPDARLSVRTLFWRDRDQSSADVAHRVERHGARWRRRRRHTG